MTVVRETGNKLVASVPSGSTSSMVRSPSVSPRTMQRAHAQHGSGGPGDKRMTSPKGSTSKVIRISTGTDARGRMRGNIALIKPVVLWPYFGFPMR